MKILCIAGGIHLIVLSLFALLAAALAGLLYHYMPNKKIYICIIIGILAIGGLTYTFLSAHKEQQAHPVLTKAEMQELQSQQQTFADWYANYQKDIDELNRNWTWYHHILADFQDDNISLQTAYVRLKHLDQDSQQLRDKIAKEAPPLSLNDQCYDLVTSILQKTSAYANDQYRTIALTKAAADPANMQTDDHDAQSELLQTVMNRESPAGLYTSTEITAINNLLSMPTKNNETNEENTNHQDDKE